MQLNFTVWVCGNIIKLNDKSWFNVLPSLICKT